MNDALKELRRITGITLISSILGDLLFAIIPAWSSNQVWGGLGCAILAATIYLIIQLRKELREQET